MSPSMLNLTLIMILLAGSRSEATDPDKFLEVQTSQIMSSLASTIAFVGTMKSSLSSLGSGSKGTSDLGMTSAFYGCMEMVDLSEDVLQWSLCTIQKNPHCPKIGTGDRISDLNTWLSGTISLLETCLDDLNDGVSLTGDLIPLRTTLSKGSSLARDLLNMVTQNFSQTGRANTEKTQFPSWVTRKDRKLLESPSPLELIPDVVVAKDGTGHFMTISDAIAAAPEHSMSRHVIFVKSGVYEEVVEIKKKKWNIMLVGEGMEKTVLRWNRSVRDGFKTFDTATIGISGIGFIACDMSFENTAGPGSQAVALRSDSDLSVYYRCGFYGFQDTLYPHSMRQFYQECQIKGTIDFIFGYATAMFQNCVILVRKGMLKQTTNSITANGRRLPDSSGFSFHHCNIGADQSLVPHLSNTVTFLGRPWKDFARTVFMESYMSEIVRPEGWLPWEGRELLDTVFYGEYQNYGPGSGTGGRVKWPSYHVINDPAQASMFTVGKFIEGDLWLPSTGIGYTSGL